MSPELELEFEYDELTEEFIAELDNKTTLIIAGGNRGEWAQYFNSDKGKIRIKIRSGNENIHE